MRMLLKQSRYNHIIDIGDYLLIYNSLSKVKSLCKINKLLHPQLCDCLQTGSVLEYDSNEYNELINNSVLNYKNSEEESYQSLLRYSSLYNSGTNIILMPTEQCNFRCTYCYENFEKPKMSKETVENIKGYLLRNVSRIKKLSIDWFGGEPLCAVNLIEEIMQYCKDTFKKVGTPVISTMTTNGYLLTPELILKLIKLNIVGYQITIDGVERIHDKQRKLYNGEGTYKQILGNLIDIKNTLQTGVVQICIRVNLNATSVQYVEELFEVFKEHFECDKRFSLSLRYVRDLKGDGNTADIIDEDSVMLKVYEKAYKIIPRLLTSHFLNMLDSSGICYAGKPNSIVIGADGSLYKCTVHFNDDINVGGKIDGNRLNVDEKKLAKWVFLKPKCDECSRCWYRGSCYEGTCPYATLVGKDSPTCPFEKIHIDYILKTLDNYGIIKEI